MFAKDQQRTVVTVMVLMLGTVLLYWPVRTFDFINWDDGLYVLNNEHINHGFSWLGLRWCFQIGYAGYWHPITWISHMVDCELFGLHPGPPHLENLLLHAANSALLFLVLSRMTRTYWRSAMVAALFAWHPLRVESVAWIAERKDVLSVLFWMLALWSYVFYVEKLSFANSKTYYLLTLVFFALGLMAKPMIVTLPCVLLLLDWWPLGRFGPGAPRPYSRVIVEKLPFVLLAAGSSILTVIAQKQGGAVASLEFVPLETRVLNCLVSYLRYVEKLFWPSDLSVIYSFVFKLPLLEVLLAVIFLVGITAASVFFWKRQSYLLVGWLWYLGVLFPVSGLVQAGGQSMADRFSYVPSIGVYIMICWAAYDLTRRWPKHGEFLVAIGAVALTVFGIQTAVQVRYWRNSGTLFKHSIAIDPDNYIARSCYGCYLRDLGELEPARVECQRAIEICPVYMVGYTFLSGVLEMQGRKDDAMAVLRDALKIRPDFSGARCDMARLLFDKNQFPEAEAELDKGLELDPTDAGLHLYLGHALAGEGKYESAEGQFAESARLEPQDATAHFQWAVALAAEHKFREAIAQYRAALRVKPDFANALNNLAWLLSSNPDAKLRNGREAVQLALRACAITQTNDAIKIETLANACAEAGRFEEAVSWARRASEVAVTHGQTNVAQQNLELQQLYRAHHAFYQYQ